MVHNMRHICLKALNSNHEFNNRMHMEVQNAIKVAEGTRTRNVVKEYLTAKKQDRHQTEQKETTKEKKRKEAQEEEKERVRQANIERVKSCGFKNLCGIKKLRLKIIAFSRLFQVEDHPTRSSFEIFLNSFLHMIRP